MGARRAYGGVGVALCARRFASPPSPPLVQVGCFRLGPIDKWPNPGTPGFGGGGYLLSLVWLISIPVSSIPRTEPGGGLDGKHPSRRARRPFGPGSPDCA